MDNSAQGGSSGVDNSQAQNTSQQNQPTNVDSGVQNTTPPPASNSDFNIDEQLGRLEKQINEAKMPQDLHDKAIAMLNRLKIIKNDSGFFMEYDSINRYMGWITALPWNKPSQDILDLNHARQVLDHNHYGLNDTKQKILEYLAIMINNKKRGASEETVARAPIISLVGLVGVGKTTIAYSIAEALGRKIERIPFGGMGSASQLRGKTRLFPDAEPGLVIKALRNAGTSNPVILLDEIDRVSAEARADIMGVLVELLDPNQNKAFTDHFIDYPVNLQNVLFIATSNNTKDISTAVLDRLEIIQMPSYTDEEKIVIAKNYLLPRVLKESSLTGSDLVVDDNVWEDIVRPLGYDSGIRSLQRVIQGLVRKVIYFQLTGQLAQGGYRITRENVKSFVPQW